MRNGKCSSRLRHHDAACSSRASSIEREWPCLAARYGLNAKTVRKRRRRTTTYDSPMVPSVPKSTMLTLALLKSLWSWSFGAKHLCR